MKVIILSKTDYKEKDCIFNAISENEYLSFQAKGAQENKSPYVWLNNPLTVADVEFLQDGRYKHKVLKSAILVSTPFIKKEENLDYYFATSILLELVKNAVDDADKHETYNEIIEAMSALKSKKDALIVVLIFIARLLKISGIALQVDKCVHCGSTKDVVAFSFNDGGFVCRNCESSETVRDLTTTQMKMIRAIFKAKDYTCIQDNEYERADEIYLLNKFKLYIDESLGVNLKSLNLLLK